MTFCIVTSSFNQENVNNSTSGIFAHAEVGDEIPKIFGAWMLHSQDIVSGRVNIVVFRRADAAAKEVNAILAHIVLFSG